MTSSPSRSPAARSIDDRGGSGARTPRPTRRTSKAGERIPNPEASLNVSDSSILAKALPAEAISDPGAEALRIEPREGWVGLGLRELWEYRELLYFLTWRNIKVRYKQTVLGASWAILQPFMTMVVFSLFFGKMARMPSDGIPYPIWSYAALVPWQFFANGMSQSSNILVQSSNLIKKIYFPRLAMPLSSVLSGAVDFVLAFIVLLAMVAAYGIVPTANIVWLPALFLLAFVTSLGAGMVFSALNVQFRDVKYAVPFLVQLWMFASPIAYPSSLLEEPWRTVYAINPMVGVVEGFRWALLGTDTAPGLMILVSSLVAVAMLVGGAYYFRRLERTFADVV